jgi:hypothetical protein
LLDVSLSQQGYGPHIAHLTEGTMSPSRLSLTLVSARREPVVAVLAALIAIGTACSEPARLTSVPKSAPENPPAVTPPAVTPPAVTRPVVTPPPGVPFPALVKPGTIYVEAAPFYAAFTPMPLVSRFVLYDDGTHGLQFAQFSETEYGNRFEYRGRYTRTGGDFVFEWEGWSVAGPWGANGTLRGEELTVKFNVIMMLSDFMDGTYVRAP